MKNDNPKTNSLILPCYSGGGSALLPLPIGLVSLEEKYHIIKLLQTRGATIQELNTVRQSMSQVKNGGLARMARASTVTHVSYSTDSCITVDIRF
jgi:glycerate 2-kinase